MKRLVEKRLVARSVAAGKREVRHARDCVMADCILVIANPDRTTLRTRRRAEKTARDARNWERAYNIAATFDTDTTHGLFAYGYRPEGRNRSSVVAVAVPWPGGA